MFGQFVDDFDARQISRQRFTFATSLGWSNGFFVRGLIDGLGQTFHFVEQRQLWGCRVVCLLGLTSEQALSQQRNFLFEMNDLALVGRALVDHLLKQLLEQNRVVREVFGHGNHAADYTESGDVSRRQNLMWTIAPQVKTVEQPVEFLHSQDDCNVSGVR